MTENAYGAGLSKAEHAKAARERWKKVYDMRQSGMRFKQIADALGITETRAGFMYRKAVNMFKTEHLPSSQ